MNMAARILLAASLLAPLSAETVLQSGIESVVGTNRMLLWTPWIGVRHNLSSSSSLLLKCYFHNLRFRYLNLEEQETDRSANLLNLTGAYYRQSPSREYYAALSYLSGPDKYTALALDAGLGMSVLKWLTVETGIYVLNESSILWLPEEEVRRITLGALKAGLRFKVFRPLQLNLRAILYRNNEAVGASALAAGLLFMPLENLYLSLGVSRYSESASYRFQGTYLELGLNYYR